MVGACTGSVPSYGGGSNFAFNNDISSSGAKYADEKHLNGLVVQDAGDEKHPSALNQYVAQPSYSDHNLNQNSMANSNLSHNYLNENKLNDTIAIIFKNICGDLVTDLKKLQQASTDAFAKNQENISSKLDAFGAPNLLKLETIDASVAAHLAKFTADTKRQHLELSEFMKGIDDNVQASSANKTDSGNMRIESVAQEANTTDNANSGLEKVTKELCKDVIDILTKHITTADQNITASLTKHVDNIQFDADKRDDSAKTFLVSITQKIGELQTELKTGREGRVAQKVQEVNKSNHVEVSASGADKVGAIASSDIEQKMQYLTEEHGRLEDLVERQTVEMRTFQNIQQATLDKITSLHDDLVFSGGAKSSTSAEVKDQTRKSVLVPAAPTEVEAKQSFAKN